MVRERRRPDGPRVTAQGAALEVRLGRRARRTTLRRPGAGPLRACGRMVPMPQPPEPIRRFYADWTQYQSRLVDAVRGLTSGQLAISAAPDHAPTWADRCLDAWTTDMLEVEFERRRGNVRRMHTRRSILLRLLTHDAFHSGEISELLGSNGLPAIDLWAGKTT